uniref:G_PROTEIN_RECEP_F3_4 domain-containing protein n=1 Tax=Macrostomum lignano TaxID=282301 RepID=A0A1I8G4Q9_9PLAT
MTESKGRVERVAIDGDVTLGGLFPVTRIDCSTIDIQRGIQRVEAMIFSLAEANKDSKLLRYGRHKIRLGGLLLDTCSREATALEQALEFVKSSLSSEYDIGLTCSAQGGTLASGSKEIGQNRILGVVGGAYSQVSIQVANLLRMFALPQISYASTSSALSDKTRFGLFARTVPPDTEQARALADIVAHFNWTFVSTVATTGRAAFRASRPEAEKRGVCTAERLLVGGEPSARELDGIVQRLLDQPRARVVVLFTRQDHTELFLDAVSRANVSAGRFVWLSADGWGKSYRPVANNSRAADGAVTLEVAASELPGFNQYFASLRPNQPRQIQSADGTKSNMYSNRFFDRFWEQNFNCVLSRTHQSLVSPKRQQKSCGENLRIDIKQFKQESKVQFVYDAVLTFVHGLDKVMKRVCSPQDPSADTKTSGAFDRCPTDSSAAAVVDGLGDPAGRRVEFTPEGDGMGAYTVYNYRATDSAVSGHPVYAAVGEWRKDSSGTGKISWFDEASKIRWPTGASNSVPKSRCSEDCRPGQRRLYSAEVFNKALLDVARALGSREEKGFQRDSKIVSSTGGNHRSRGCCWSCTDCLPHQRLVAGGDACEDCPTGQGPDASAGRTRCLPLRITHIRWTSWYAIVPCSLSSAGICATLFVVVTFMNGTAGGIRREMMQEVVAATTPTAPAARFNETPVVKASGREQSYALLIGCLLCYLTSFLLLAKPSPAVCALQRCGVGLGFAVIYAALHTKTNRIARIFEAARRTARRPSFISPRSQLLITAGLISVQLASTLLWLVVDPPATRVLQPHRLAAVLVCRVERQAFIASLLYNACLIIVCTYFAVRTRRIPENFNESKFIGFTMYTTCVIWLAFVPLYFGTESSVEVCTLCISISLSATVALTCLFAPKLYIIFWQPEKNVRKLTVHSNHYRRNASSSGSFAMQNPIADASSNQHRQQRRLSQDSEVVQNRIGSPQQKQQQIMKRRLRLLKPPLSLPVSHDVVNGLALENAGTPGEDVCIDDKPEDSVEEVRQPDTVTAKPVPL